MMLDVKGKAHVDEIIVAMSSMFKDSGGVKIES